MANATLLTGRSCRGYLYTLAGLFFALLLVMEVCKWEVHVGSEGIELIRKAGPGAANVVGLDSAAAKSMAASKGKNELAPRKAPRARRKYSLPWKRAPESSTRTSSFHNGVRSSKLIEGELGLGFWPKLELEAGTLTWSAEAEDFLLGEIVNRQFPKDCGAERWLVIEPHRHGKPVTMWTSDPCELKVVQRSSSARITLILLLLGCKEKTYIFVHFTFPLVISIFSYLFGSLVSNLLNSPYSGPLCGHQSKLCQTGKQGGRAPLRMLKQKPDCASNSPPDHPVCISQASVPRRTRTCSPFSCPSLSTALSSSTRAPATPPRLAASLPPSPLSLSPTPTAPLQPTRRSEQPLSCRRRHWIGGRFSMGRRTRTAWTSSG
jgi:hypothetical protein